MKLQKTILLFCMLLLTFNLTACNTSNISSNLETNSSTDDTVFDANASVNFLDVGQADCILIQSNGHNMMIDAGNSDDYEVISNYLNDHNVKELDYLILTHPHEDHIGSAAKIIDNYKIDKIMMCKLTMTTKIYESLITSIENSQSELIVPEQGSQYNIGDGIFTILSDQNNDWGDDANEWSIGLKLSFNDIDFIFTGDANALEEQAMIKSGIDLNAEVLKVGHHGSYTASSDEFLDEVMPEYAVISCGVNNSYGHPHDEVINKLSNYNVDIFRTDTMGTITATINNNTINWNQTGEIVTTETNKDSNNDSNNIETYILNINTGKFHLPNCESVGKMNVSNKKQINSTYSEMLNKNYSPCQNCLSGKE